MSTTVFIVIGEHGREFHVYGGTQRKIPPSGVPSSRNRTLAGSNHAPSTNVLAVASIQRRCITERGEMGRQWPELRLETAVLQLSAEISLPDGTHHPHNNPSPPWKFDNGLCSCLVTPFSTRWKDPRVAPCLKTKYESGRSGATTLKTNLSPRGLKSP